MWRTSHAPTRLLVASIAICAAAMIGTSIVVLATLERPDTEEPEAAVVIPVPRVAVGFECLPISFDGASETVDPLGGRLRVACYVDTRGESWAVTQASGFDGALGTPDDRCWYTSSPPCTPAPVIGAPGVRID
jgi:hypothetical protein